MSVARSLAQVVPITGQGCRVEDVGGKGAGLDRLASNGFPIPTTYAVTSEAYRECVAAAGLDTWLPDLAGRPAPEPARLASEVDEIESTFLDVPLRPGLEAAIETVASQMLRAGPVAVRSSATAEDLGVASFAGQYRTFTRVDDVAGVVVAMKRCWASLWLPAAREYRARHGIPADDLAMAVLLQSMVDADWSGVGFTLDPATNRAEMRVEMVPGLGEALVSGHVTPLDFTIRRDTLEIVGTDSTRHPPGCLENLARMMLQVEDRLDEPQDIEWASIGHQIILLQARPITVVGPQSLLDDGFDAPVHSDDEFTPNGIVEMLPGVVTPLLWTINAPMIEHGYRATIADLGADAGAPDRPFLGRFRGRAALNLSALRDTAASLPGGSARDVEEQFLGRTTSEDAPTGRGASLRALWRARRSRKRLEDEIDLVTTAIDAIVGLDVDSADLPAWRLAGYRHSIRDLAWRASAAEVAASSAASAAYRRLETLLARWLDPSSASMWAQRLTAGTIGRHAAGGRLDREICDACLRARAADPHVVDTAGASPTRIPDRLHDLGPVGDDLAADVLTAARRAGSKAVYGGPTWEESPDLVWQRLHVTAGRCEERRPASDTGDPLAELSALLQAPRSWRLVRVVTGQIVDLRIRWIENIASESTYTLRLREHAKAALLTLGGEERRIIVEIADRLVASHQLDDADDVTYLTDMELDAMLLGEAPPAAADLHWRKAAAESCRAAPPLPDVFSGEPVIEIDDHGDGRVLMGWPASPGQVEAPARVVTSLEDAARLREGDVLVAPATDPSWTPVIVNASAIVLETGGPLSHAAIVAREFGIPAVLKVGRATSVLDDGEPIAVDGHAGSVVRLTAVEVEA